VVLRASKPNKPLRRCANPQFYNNETAVSPDQKAQYNNYVAALVTGLPIATIAFGSEVCPSMQKDPRVHSKKNVKTTLEVEWVRVAITVGLITTG